MVNKSETPFIDAIIKISMAVDQASTKIHELLGMAKDNEPISRVWVVTILRDSKLNPSTNIFKTEEGAKRFMDLHKNKVVACGYMSYLLEE